jgi:succinate dehydrogenase assembly factor 2
MFQVLRRPPCLYSRFTRRPLSTTQHLCADPWLLPNTPEHLASTTSPADLRPPTPLARPNESTDTLRARLVYQSRKRGTLESDLLLSTFAGEQLSVMDEKELKEFDKVCFLMPRVRDHGVHYFSAFCVVLQLLDEPDWDIYYWSTGKRTPPERWANSSVLEKLAIHARNEGKVVRSMPPLP